MEMKEDKIDITSLKEALNTRSLGREILFFEQLDSTNTQAKRLIKEEAEEKVGHGLLILAEEQTSGRGRLGRDWSSPKRGGIWMSFVLNPRLPAESCPMLTLVAAVAVNEAIRRVSGLDSFIKWPNDIVINAKKVCGILTEATGLLSEGPNIILGIGINANRKDFPGELGLSATSLSLEGEKDINRSLLIAEICNSLEKYYEEFTEQGDLTGLKAEYEKYLINRGKQVRVLAKDGEYTGTALGINGQGGLLVETKEKEITTVVSGEVSVRGIFGYV